MDFVYWKIKKILPLTFIILTESCYKKTVDSNLAAVDTAKPDIKKTIETTRAVITSLYSQSDAPDSPFEIVNHFDRKWNDGFIAHASNFLEKYNLEFKKVYGGMSFIRFRLTDSQGVVHAQFEPSLSPYYALASVSDIYFKDEPKLAGDPTQTIRNIMAEFKASYYFETPTYYREPNDLALNKLLYPLKTQQGRGWDYEFKDPRAYKYQEPGHLSRSGQTWFHLGTIPELVSVTKKPSLRDVHIESQNVELAKNLRAGQTVEFKIILDCNTNPLLERSCWVNSGRFSPSPVRVGPASLRVRQIRDRDIKIPGTNLSFHAKEALGFLDSSITGRDQHCVIGRTVFDDQGRVYGVVTDYTPGGVMGVGDSPEVDNIVIATVQDERIKYLLDTWYQRVSVAEATQSSSKHFGLVYSDVPTTPWKATKLEDQFDPEFLSELQSEDKLMWYALARTKVEACGTTQDLVQVCENEITLLRQIRDSFSTKTRALPPPRKTPNITCRYFSSASYAKPKCAVVRRPVP